MAIARLMEATNIIDKNPSLEGYKHIIGNLYPFSPHLCEDIWSKLGSGKSLYEGGYNPVIELD